MKHLFDVDVAVLCGVESAVLLENIYFWVIKNRANNKHFYEGRYWTYNTYEAFEEIFPYWTARQVRGRVKKLEDAGLILIGNFNKNVYDNTNWYTLTDKALELYNDKVAKEPMTSQSPNLTQVSDRPDRNVRPIPYINTDNKQHIYNNSSTQEKNTKDNNITKEELSTIRDKWNSVVEGTKIPKIRTINRNTKRFSMLNARYKDYGLETLLEGIDSIKRSSFLKGETKANWCITFDWYIAPNNIIKVLEGNYIDKSSPTSTTLNNPDYRVSTKEDLARDDDGNLIVF